jgi:hypothetical protein
MITKRRLRQLTKHGKPSQKEAREMAAALLAPLPPRPRTESLLDLRLIRTEDPVRCEMRYRLEATPVEAVVVRRWNDKRKCVDRRVAHFEIRAFDGRALIADRVEEAGALLGKALAQDLLLHPHI